MCRRKSFEFVAYHAFGVTGKLLVELGVIGFLMGTSVAFFVVIGDLAPTIVEKLFQLEYNEHLRTFVLLGKVFFTVHKFRAAVFSQKILETTTSH